MINARAEFEEEVEGLDVVCAWICFAQNYRFNMENAIYLKEGHTPEEYEGFLQTISRDYDNGYGSQELKGIIWISNGDWIERQEYDGSEGWRYVSRPEIPTQCRNNLFVKSASRH